MSRSVDDGLAVCIGNTFDRLSNQPSSALRAMYTSWRLCLLAGGFLSAMTIPCAGQQSPAQDVAPASPKVTVHLKATPLRDALKEVSRLTAVPLSATSDTADLKVTVLVKDLPLDILRSRLAETLHLTWVTHEATKDRPASYLLFRSKQNKDEESELETRGERAFRKGINDAIAALSLGPEARAKLFALHPALAATFAQRGGEAVVTLLAQLSPQLRENIMDGNALDFPSSKPPAELAPHFDEVMKKLNSANSENPNAIYAQLLKQEGKFSVTRTGEGAGSQIGVAFSVQTEMLAGSLGYSVRGVHAGEVYLGAYAPDHTGADYASAHSPVTVPTKLTAKSLEDLMEQVADTLHINIVGESYSLSLPKNAQGETVYPLSVEGGASTIAKVLGSVVWQNTWWKHGSVYIFQRPLWWIDRRKEVSDATLSALKQVFKTRPLAFEAMAEVAKALSAEQWGHLSEVMDSAHVYPEEGQTVMRFYGHLSDLRKADLFLNGGTNASVFNDADQLRLRKWIEEKGKEALQKVRNIPGSVYVLAKREAPVVKTDPVLFRALFQANDGTTILLREEIVMDGYVDPAHADRLRALK
jgi:hypothetical protein